MMTRDDAIERIALDLLGLETLQPRKRDRLDFHDLAVWDIREAQEAAYTAGFESGKARRR
jgi:hypothetical protein